MLQEVVAAPAANDLLKQLHCPQTLSDGDGISQELSVRGQFSNLNR